MPKGEKQLVLPNGKPCWQSAIAVSQKHTIIMLLWLFINVLPEKLALTGRGGLALGCGGVIDGKPLVSLGGMVRNVVKSLNLSALALAQGNPIPEQAIELIEKPLLPNWLYSLGGQIGWYVQAFKLGTLKRLNDQPYRK